MKELTQGVLSRTLKPTALPHVHPVPMLKSRYTVQQQYSHFILVNGGRPVMPI